MSDAHVAKRQKLVHSLEINAALVPCVLKEWKEMKKRIGPKMARVVNFVAENPGLYMVAAAQAVGPHGSTQYGYATCHRAVRAGIVVAVQGPRSGCVRLFPVQPGQRR